MGGECGQLRRRHSGKGRAVPERLPVDPYFVMRALIVANASRSLCGAVANKRITGRRRKSSLALQPLQNPFGIAANAENLLRCIGRSRWARNLSALHLQKRTSKGDRKSTRLNSSHLGISYAVFCLKKKKNNTK